jgi:hypothetical protein
MEERYGATPAPNFGVVLALNLPWLLMPFAMMLRMRRDNPFSPADRAPDRVPDRAAPAGRPGQP